MNKNRRYATGPSWSVNLVPLPPTEFIRSKLSYDEESGLLRWSNGKIAGCKQFRKDGTPNAIRVGFNIGGKLVQFVAHRLIFALMGKSVPMGITIDHRDQNPFNNKWRNLRLATHAQNQHNRKDMPGMAMPKGVFLTLENNFGARLKCGGRVRYLGTFKTIGEAVMARQCGELKYLGEFARV